DCDRALGRSGRAEHGGPFDDQRTRERWLALMARHEAANAVECLGGDAAAVAQAACELAVGDCASPESGFGKPGLAAEIGDFLQDCVIHGTSSRWSVRREPCDKRFKSTLTGQPQKIPLAEWEDWWDAGPACMKRDFSWVNRGRYSWGS